MAVKCLPLVESPICGYMMYSYHLAVTFSHVDAWPWFFSNFVQLQCDPAQLSLSECLKFTAIPKGEVNFTEGTWLYNPWLRDSAQVGKAELLASSGGSASRFVIDKLEDGYYVETFIDEFYVPVLANGGKAHFRHRLLVFGYDDVARKFNIVGFNQKRQYANLQCDFDQFDQAFEAVSPQWFEKTKLFRPQQCAGPTPGFDMERLVRSLRDYLTSENTFLNTDLHGAQASNTPLWHGLKCYDFLSEYISSARDRGVGRPDIRGFHTIWEHKKCMRERMKCLQRLGYGIDDALIVEYSRAVWLCELARNRVVMVARGLTQQKTGHLTEVPRYLREAKAIESSVIRQLMDVLTPALGQRASASRAS